MDKNMAMIQLCVLVLILHTTCEAHDPESLWGREVVFESTGCQFWCLNSDQAVPDLQDFTVCVDIQRSINSSDWSVFTYWHPDRSRVELGFGGRAMQLQVRLFGYSWVTADTLTLGEWHSVCITWSCSTSELQLFINSTLTELRPDPGNPDQDGDLCTLAGYGSLTLGAAHYYIGDNVEVENGTNLQGNITLFRMWSTARSPTAIYTCTDGDIIQWQAKAWKPNPECPPALEKALACVWSLYVVKAQLCIVNFERNITTTYEVQDIVRHWLETVLPTSMNVPRVVASAVESHFDELCRKKDDYSELSVGAAFNRFDILAYLTVIPGEDVRKIQRNVSEILGEGFQELPHYSVITNHHFIQIYPTDLNISAILPHPTSDTTVTLINHTTVSPDTVTPSAEVTDSFFKVSLNVTIGGSAQDPEDTIQTWLNEIFSQKGYLVLNFRLTSQQTQDQRLINLSHDSGVMPTDPVKAIVIPAQSYSCEFQMLVLSCSNLDATQKEIRSQLEQTYIIGTVQIFAPSEEIIIVHIEPGSCPKHTQQNRKGLYVWPSTPLYQQRIKPCEGDPIHTASRQCLLSVTTNQALWMPPDLQTCPILVKTLSDLEQITITNETARDVLQMVMDLMAESKLLSETDLWLVLSTMEEVLKVSTVTLDLAQVIINITSDILTSNSNLHPFTNNILNITETVGDKMSEFSGNSISFVAPTLALSVVEVNREHRSNLTFGVTEMNNNPRPEVYINQDPFEGMVAFISLPPSIHTSFPRHCSPRVQFQFYGVPTLFQDHQSGKVLNTYVVSASVINAVGPVKDLEHPVVVMLHHLKTDLMDKDAECVYWNFSKNGGHGGWSNSGCWRYNMTDEYTTCLCDHLTHFGVLLDVSRTPISAENERILTIISYVGCGVSSFFLGVTVLTYTLLEKLRRDYPSQILLNLSLALLGLNLVFLVNSWLSSFGLSALCVAVATIQHYFLLASFGWMFLEAVNMYLALVKVFNVYVPSYILKFCLLGWGVPLVICGLVLVVKPSSYALLPLQNSEMFCWVSDDVVFYVCVVGVVALVLLVNGSVFLVVLVQVRRARVSERSSLMKELRGVSSLTLLLGLTWITAFFTWGSAKVPLLYLFSILNSLQGFFIFVFQCLMKENVRKQWRVHLCFGRFKLQEHSEWSHTLPVVAKPKHKPVFRFSMVASVRSDKSSSTQSSSASSHSLRRADLAVVYQQNFALPRAQRVKVPLPEDRGYGAYSLNGIPKESSNHNVYYN